MQTKSSGCSTLSGWFRPARALVETEGMLYEACPVGSALEERQTDACFTAYLPEDILKGRDFSVILCRDGKFYRNSCETIWE